MARLRKEALEPKKPDPAPAPQPEVKEEAKEPVAAPEPEKPKEKVFQAFTQINVTMANSTPLEALVIPGKGVLVAARNYGFAFLHKVEVNDGHLV